MQWYCMEHKDRQYIQTSWGLRSDTWKSTRDQSFHTTGLSLSLPGATWPLISAPLCVFASFFSLQSGFLYSSANEHSSATYIILIPDTNGDLKNHWIASLNSWDYNTIGLDKMPHFSSLDK